MKPSKSSLFEFSKSLEDLSEEDKALAKKDFELWGTIFIEDVDGKKRRIDPRSIKMIKRGTYER